MTIIVWDGRTLAADCQGTYGDARIWRNKITRRADGTLIATAGSFSLAQAMVNHLFGDPGSRPNWPTAVTDESADVICVDPDARVTWYTHFRPVAIELHQAQMAWGCGREFAMGALAMGANAVRAVEVAIELCPGCGLGVQVERPGIENPG